MDSSDLEPYHCASLRILSLDLAHSLLPLRDYYTSYTYTYLPTISTLQDLPNWLRETGCREATQRRCVR